MRCGEQIGSWLKSRVLEGKLFTTFHILDDMKENIRLTSAYRTYTYSIDCYVKGRNIYFMFFFSCIISLQYVMLIRVLLPKYPP